MTAITDIISVVELVRGMPYRWPAGPTADDARAAGWGSCASKHALLAEELDALGVPSRPLLCVGKLVPDVLAHVPGVDDGVGLVEVHELLTMSVPGVGPCRVDITWDPVLVAAGLPGTLAWDGRSDMDVAVGRASGFHAPDPPRLREEKEALRHRLYGDGERSRRDRALAAMSTYFDQLRAAA